MVRIPAFHAGGPGSIPGVGGVLTSCLCRYLKVFASRDRQNEAEFADTLPYKVMACLVEDFNHIPWPRGLMDKASDFGSEDCEFESRRGQKVLSFTLCILLWHASDKRHRVRPSSVRGSWLCPTVGTATWIQQRIYAGIEV